MMKWLYNNIKTPNNDIHVMFMTDGVSSRGKNISEKKRRIHALFKKLNLNNPIFKFSRQSDG